ncbi:molecular chaperone HtpG [Rhodoblastus acidophilus]|uniref:Chaperone protein HtpG n=1 Tax=Rhodoblastus acidophilus TaxID=1074 RepID=A0A212R4P2_RHOAC|nr:molecular chaperone HtpG [Rhodoblastus acidophilus]PPQ36540.1 molecular chaperone HtpG [Rhodoblastus acidophilus]RAI16413.1 molecular chaperone HtpG [Rhodoblastus acidophilus]SNB66846.1 molecular chaperone HtpG [Rhodoblastus acidophilus]
MTDETAAPAEKHVFQADVARLLHLMVHSIYSERDIFLRELISNAADACEKLRYEANSDSALTQDGEAFSIKVALDPEAGTLSVIDNGVGMNRDELNSALGTIANSGTRAFLEKMKVAENSPNAAELIGQFGIGFYSAFMVADRVVVETRRAGEETAWRWTSDGKGDYEVSPLPLGEAPARGSRVILHLNEESKEAYTKPYTIERLISEHSSAVATPIDLVEKPGEEPRRIGEGAALWAKNKSEITPEQYKDFYQNLSGQFDEPALTIHWKAEGRAEYTVLAFVPGSRPFDLFDPSRKGKAKLYSRRVLISKDADLLPGYLRFMRLVVDSPDLPLNVSRELVQQNAVYAAIKKGVANRLLQELTKLAENEPDKFDEVWKHFGAVLKEGLYEDPERRDALLKMARFATTEKPEGGRSLTDYVANLRPNQTAIYYIAGDGAERIAASPQLEGFRARGVEVLLLSDPVDAFWASSATGFDGKPFKSITQGSADIKDIEVTDESQKKDENPEASAKFVAAAKGVLESVVEDVRVSDRLSTSPACLIAPEFGLDLRLQQILASHGQAPDKAKPVLEINPAHPLVKALEARTGDQALFEDAVWLLFDEARLMDGEQPHDSSAFAARLIRVLGKAAGAQS